MGHWYMPRDGEISVKLRCDRQNWYEAFRNQAR